MKQRSSADIDGWACLSDWTRWSPFDRSIPADPQSRRLDVSRAERPTPQRDERGPRRQAAESTFRLLIGMSSGSDGYRIDLGSGDLV